jgi:hypothetical protein
LIQRAVPGEIKNEHVPIHLKRTRSSRGLASHLLLHFPCNSDSDTLKLMLNTVLNSLLPLDVVLERSITNTRRNAAQHLLPPHVSAAEIFINVYFAALSARHLHVYLNTASGSAWQRPKHPDLRTAAKRGSCGTGRFHMHHRDRAISCRGRFTEAQGQHHRSACRG